MIKIKSYLKYPKKIINNLEDTKKNPQKYYVEINDVEKLEEIKKDLDSFYVEGVITFSYNNGIIFDFTYWDLIDQLWAYFINLIEDLEENNEAETVFPDQPIDISLKKIQNNKIFFSLITSKQKKHWIFEKDELYNAILTNAKDFFKKMIFIIPENTSKYLREIKRIEELEKQLLQFKN